MTPHSRFWALGTGDLVSHDAAEETHLCSPAFFYFFSFSFFPHHSYSSLESCSWLHHSHSSLESCSWLLLSTIAPKSGGGSLLAAAAAAASSRLPRYVGAIRFPVFMFSSFCRLDLHNVTCVAWAELWRRSISKTWNENRASPWFLYGDWKCMFLDGFREGNSRSSQLCPLLSVLYLIKFEAVWVQSLLSVCLFYGSCSLISPYHTPNKYRCSIKKCNE